MAPVGTVDLVEIAREGLAQVETALSRAKDDPQTSDEVMGRLRSARERLTVAIKMLTEEPETGQ